MQLTDEQIEAAAKAMYEASMSVFDLPRDTGGCHHTLATWKQVPGHAKERFRHQVRAAAPFLQMPWEMPTMQELETCCTLSGFISGRNII